MPRSGRSPTAAARPARPVVANLHLTFNLAATPTQQEAAMAKSQKRSNREIRKPKQKKAKVEAAPRSFLEVAGQGASQPGGKKGSSR